MEVEELEEDDDDEFSSADESSADGDIDFWYVQGNILSLVSVNDP